MRVGAYDERFLTRNGLTAQQLAGELLAQPPGTRLPRIRDYGEIYGPVVANLYVPITFRPWVISNMMEKEVMKRRAYKDLRCYRVRLCGFRMMES